ncbi:hypothetical protein XENORESO_005694 [Xenotaenia resolanae]|uniref:Uncharacterized protein n=1 Tax=Xenotaenia resolanae TaxID=208358 RepID=A0ABV0W3S7_9TELE
MCGTGKTRNGSNLTQRQKNTQKHQSLKEMNKKKTRGNKTKQIQSNKIKKSKTLRQKLELGEKLVKKYLHRNINRTQNKTFKTQNSHREIKTVCYKRKHKMFTEKQTKN